MTASRPQTPEEWERFRFPSRAARRPADAAEPSEDQGEGKGEGESEGGSKGGGPHLEPDLPPAPAWNYCPHTGMLKNKGLRKQIDLADLNEAQKIVRLLAVFELRPDLAYASLRRSLEAAAQDRFGVTLETLLLSYRGGEPIAWRQEPSSSVSRSIRGP